MAVSSSSSFAAAAKKYDVFINFRGEDTRHSFVSHLYDSLCRSSVEAYIDRELHKGDEISPSLFQAIEDSHGSLVVFSKNYAFSKWCLNELLKILECRRRGHFVIPVFYNIDPSEVRNQNGSCGEAFAKHEQDSKNEAMLEKWKAALAQAANIVGWDSQSRNYQNESELIQNIVKDVLGKLDHIYPLNKSGLVGIDERCEHIEVLLQKFPVVGIWGIGGIGKTTIAKAIYDKLYSQYDSCCFIENVREESQRRGPNQLRDNLLSQLLKDSVISINQHIGLKHALRRLSSKKVLIVLDDVDNSMQLEHLGQEYKSLGPGSRVIITTRDKQLVTSLRVEHVIYEVERLSFEESLMLFRLNAFSEDYPEEGYEKITEKIVSYTQGTPLALKILGSFLLSKTREEWESECKKLNKIPNEEIGKVLKLSFDGLSYENQQIFLDIACFLKGNDKETVISLLDSYGFYGAIGIRTLQDKALITLSENCVQMHDLIQEMGWEIVREESIGEPGRRSRLWDPEEVYDILKYNKATGAVQGVILDMSQIKDLNLSVDTFKKMTNLRFLKFYLSNYEKSGKIHIPVNIQLFFDKLRYLHWDKCPLPSLSSTFCAEKLVELKMPFSNMKKLWNGVQDLVNLENLDLSASTQLIELPDFSKASSLKWVILSNCTNLRHIHPSILSLHTLEFLNLYECKKLRSLRSEVHMKSLEYLNVDHCSSLKEFSLTSEKIRELDIKGTSVEILHSSIRRCNNLERLNLHGSLKNLPSELLELASLKSLRVVGCRQLDTLNLHIVLESLPSLREIHMIDCSNLSQLKLPPSIETLCITNCPSLEIIMTPETIVCKPSCYFLTNCMELDEHSLSPIMKLVRSRIKQAALREVDLTNGSGYTHNIFYPGSSVPRWFRHRAAQNWINIEIPPHSHLLGFAFYCILSPELLPNQGARLSCCGCYCYFKYGLFTDFPSYSFERFGYEVDIELISDHVYIWYDQLQCYRLFDAMKEQRAHGQSTKELSFEFYVCAGGRYLRTTYAIKECGVCPIYASQYDINDLEMRMGFQLGYRTDDIDERVELQFDELRPSASATKFTSSVLDPGNQDISSQNTRFIELDYSASQMALSLESASGNKSKRCQDIDECVGCSEFDLQPVTQTSTKNKFVFQSPPIDISIQKRELKQSVFQTLPINISMQNDIVDSSEKFSCGCFIGLVSWTTA